MKKNRLASGLLAMLLLFSVSAAGCSSKATDSGSSSSGPGTIKEELIVAQNADAKSLDPHMINDGPSLNVVTQLYDTLITKTKAGEFVPNLAESWEAIDDLTLQFKLVKGVKFHNGEELKAKDVKFSLERALASPTVNYLFTSIKSVDVVDDYTVNINMNYQYSAIYSNLAYTSAVILNEKAVTEAGEDYGQKPVGTGPYVFSGWQTGDSIDLIANEEYFKGAAPTKKVKYRSITENSSRSIALETGEVDIAFDIDPVDKEMILANDKLQLIDEESLSLTYIGFNMKKPPFDKPEVRQAINYAIDKESIVQTVLLGAGKVATAPMAPGVLMSNQELEGYAYNVEKAKELLKEAGLENGFKTSIWVNDNPTRVRVAEIFQANMKEIGIEVEIDILEWGSYLDRTANGEHDMFVLAWTATTGDPDGALYAVFSGNSSASAGNKAFYSNDKVNELLEAGKEETETEKRKDIYYEAQALIVEDAPIAGLFYDTHNAGLNKNVTGFELNPSRSHKLYGVQASK